MNVPVTGPVPYGRKTQPSAKGQRSSRYVDDRRLGCDGDSVSITAATQPSIEDVMLARSPACPRCISTIPCSPMRSATTS